MTHYSGSEQRWTAMPKSAVSQLVLDRKGDPALLRRFYTKVDFGFGEGDAECWIWLGALSSEGYGDFRLARRTIRAHRVAYLLEVGPIPEEKPFLDHVDCVGRFCVRPSHLEPVDNRENTLRGRGIGTVSQRADRYRIVAERDAQRAAGRESVMW